MKKIVASLILITICFSIKAQDNFSGIWVLKTKEYISGPKYSNAVADKLSVSQLKDTLFVESVSGENITKNVFAMDGGTTVAISASRRKVIRTLSWYSDKKTLTTNAAMSLPDNHNEIDLTRVATWNLSTDGRQLFYELKSIENNHESWEVKAVYEKQ